MYKSQKEILITGCAGFIGSALTIKCLKNGFNVVGIDNINDYYEKSLKFKRLDNIKQASKSSESKFSFYEISLEQEDLLREVFNKHELKTVVNLAAQAGVRYSLKNPTPYINSNIKGFVNILENAAKYNNNRPQILIKTKNINDKVIVDIEDNGIGMTKSVQSKIFDKFYRKQTGDVHDVKGHGLGLAYVKKIIDFHNGNINVESTLGKGSVFSIQLGLFK